MKIAVYTIALNEEKFVERWYESAKDADYLLIADTGSTDKTKTIAKKLGIKVIDISIKPWRFDDARNAALAVLPSDIDYCISMDMDETLSEGWRECLEKMTGDQIEYRFNLTFKDEAEKNPEHTFVNNRIHRRHGFRWKFLMHEVIIPDRTDCVGEFCEGLEVSHHPDTEKSREQYNQMIEDSYNEYKDARYHIYQCMQLLNFNRLDEAKIVIKSLLKLKDASKIDIALAYRLLALMSKNLKLWYFAKSLISYQTRETYTSIAVHYYNKSDWFRTYYFGKKADSIKVKTSSILKDPSVWAFLPTNLMLVGKHNMKLFKWSRSYKLNKKEINLKSMITYKFKLFND
jgi:glycosyltransferase involved in cell wall biosynthesis